ncbi:hypothetical protein [Microbacterium sp.]|uniref:hypothetical protein n=1 Tax=Microbacterium sp. TaxID=51671 RepID=UPI0033401946
MNGPSRPSASGEDPTTRRARSQADIVARWAAIGWEAAPGGTLGGVVETASGRGWSVARLSAGGQHLVGQDLGADRCRALVAMQGGLEAALDSGGHRLATGSILIVNGDVPIELRSSEGAAWFEWQLFSPPSGLVRSGTIRAVPLRVADGMLRMIASMTASLLVVTPEDNGRREIFLHRALSQVMVAAIGDDLFSENPEETLFRHALSVVAANADDPSFDVSRLCEILQVSRSRLFAVFSAHGTSPAKEIRRRRSPQPPPV